MSLEKEKVEKKESDENTIIFNGIEYKLVKILSETRKDMGVKVKKHSEEIFYVLRSITVNRCSLTPGKGWAQHLQN